LLAAVALPGCGEAKSKAPEKKGALQVDVSKPVVKDVTDYEVFTGRTAAIETVEVRARVTGYLDATYFKEGDVVSKYQVLALIDPRTYKAEYERTEANVGQAEAHLTRLKADYQRATIQLARKVISQEDFDKVAGDRAEADAAVRVAKASRDTAKLNLDFTRVTASTGGRIGQRMVDPGNLVKADDTLLTTIVSLDPMYAYFDVDERTVLRIRKLVFEGKVKSSRQEGRLPLYMELSDEKDFPREGYINFSDNRLDPQTGTLKARGVFHNPPQLLMPPAPLTASLVGLLAAPMGRGPFVAMTDFMPQKNWLLAPGMFVRVKVPIGTPHRAVLMAERAFGTDQGDKFLYVVQGKKVAKRYVKVAALHEGYREVEQGLNPDDQVIVDGLQRVRPNMEVEPHLIPLKARAEDVARRQFSTNQHQTSAAGGGHGASAGGKKH
jgi:RND family efflux transporter MFP subunit